MKTYHIIGQARFKNSLCDNVDVFVHATSGQAAQDKVKASLNRTGELVDFDLRSLVHVGQALEEAKP